MKCDYCRKKAIVNYQDIMAKYPVDKDGNYGDMDIIDDFGHGIETNKHLCAKHEEEFLNDTLEW